MASLQLEVVTPDQMVVNREVDYVAVPGIEGEFGILPGHIPFLSAIGTGGLYYKEKGKTKFVFVSGGFAEISDNKVSVLAESAEEVEVIDVERAEKARLRALERISMHDQGNTDIDFDRASLALHRAISRLNVKQHQLG